MYITLLFVDMELDTTNNTELDLNLNLNLTIIEKYIEKNLKNKLKTSLNKYIRELYNYLPTEKKELFNQHKSQIYGELETEFQKIKVKVKYPNTEKKNNHKKGPRIESDPKKRCMARIGLGTQCSKSRIQHSASQQPNSKPNSKLNSKPNSKPNSKLDQIDSEYCTSHSKSRPYGRIDQPMPEKYLNRVANRKKKKNKNIAYSTEGYNLTEYIKTKKVTFEDTEYLIDKEGVLYENNNKNNIIGRVKDSAIVWFKLD